MSDLKTQIRFQSRLAAQLSNDAMAAYEASNFAQGKALMKKAHEAGRNCQKLIQQLTQASTEVTQSN